MKKFWSYITNGTYSVGCTGRTVYVYDNAGNEIEKLKWIKKSPLSRCEWFSTSA